MLERNLIYKVTDFDIELIFVNDSPDEVIGADELKSCPAITPLLIINEKNKGIHYSRVEGLKRARGKYILFLDQDDRIADNYFESQLKRIGRNDVIAANGAAQYSDYEKVLYRYWIMQWTIKHIWFYVKFDNRIISPGQCLVRRSSIPAIWTENILECNGADDYFLWLAMLSQRKKFGINREVVYTHKYTSVNASSDKETMQKSVEETLSIIAPILGNGKVKMVRRRIRGNYVGKISKTLVKIVENMNKT